MNRSERVAVAGSAAPGAKNPRVAALLLAAGSGSRFVGTSHKLLAPLRGRPVVAWAVRAALEARLPATAVVVGAVDLSDVLPPEVVVLSNRRWADGQATSLQVGLTWARVQGFDAVVIGLGDQPLIEPSAWRAVADAPAAPVAIAVYGGRRGHPVRLASEVWPRLPVTGDQGARSLIAAGQVETLEIPCDGDPADVDAVDDLPAIERRTSGAG